MTCPRSLRGGDRWSDSSGYHTLRTHKVQTHFGSHLNVSGEWGEYISGWSFLFDPEGRVAVSGAGR